MQVAIFLENRHQVPGMNIKETRKHMITSILIFTIFIVLIGIHMIWRNGSVDKENPQKSTRGRWGARKH
jgi:hypothetical protein